MAKTAERAAPRGTLWRKSKKKQNENVTTNKDLTLCRLCTFLVTQMLIITFTQKKLMPSS